jgi:ABC-2 type transport system permease protein
MGSKQAMIDALAGFPPQFTAAFVGAMSLDSLFSYGGFYSFINLYLSLAGAVMACTIGFSVFAREKRAGCADFLLSKPVMRGTVFVAKLLAALTLVAAFGAIYISAAIAVYTGVAEKPLDFVAVALSAAGMIFTQIVFLAIAVFAAIFMRRVRTISGAATAVSFTAFGIELLRNLTGEEKFRYLTPFLYFDVGRPFTEGGYEPVFVVFAAVLTVELFAAAAVRSLSH